MRVTQEQRVLEWLETGEPITQYDALRELGCMRSLPVSATSSETATPSRYGLRQ